MIQGTVCVVMDEIADNDDLTATVRAFEMGFLMGRLHRRFTVKSVAQDFCMSLSGAYRLLCRASGSRRVPLVEEDGQWYVPPELDGRDWPY